MPIDEKLLAVLACPKCKGPLELTADGQGLDCRQCKLRYAINDGVPDMLVDDAEPID